jgi:hypothetical protein
MQLICRFCIAAHGLFELRHIDWPRDFPQWEVFITSHQHSRTELQQLAVRLFLPVGLIRQWSCEAIPLHTPEDFIQEED